MRSDLKTLIVVVGPTASGKTDLAISLAKYFQTEIISADSRQFYKEIQLGTAAPNENQLTAVKHHFIGHLSVVDDYNVSAFEQDVLRLLEQKFIKYKSLIMVGGSGLYINAVCNGIDDLPDPDPVLRKQLNTLFETKGIESLQEKLLGLDKEYYHQVDLNNPKRLMRAIEVCVQTGRKYSELRRNKPAERDFNVIKVGLELPRPELNERINKRTEMMMGSGWPEEARAVYRFRELNALNTVGYKELFRFYDGQWSMETAIEKIQTNTRRYAKRQMTWFKKDVDINWFSPNETQKIISFLESEI